MPAIKLKRILVGLLLWGAILVQSCAAPLVTLPFTAALSGAELALKGGDLYKQMKKADGREAFEISFEQTWDNTLEALETLSLETNKALKNEDGDGGLIEAESLQGKIRIAVLKLSERTSEVGIWAKRDQALAALIIMKIREESAPD